jgi:YgiT-type zinc finger domain-containing protein
MLWIEFSDYSSWWVMMIIECIFSIIAQARTRYVPRTYGKGKELIVIENVPVVSCPNCDASYLTSQTLKEIDRIKRERKTLAVSTSIAVASFFLSRSM